MPEFFRLHGFYTTGAGKVYHPGRELPHYR